jgi:hypothetical protein
MSFTVTCNSSMASWRPRICDCKDVCMSDSSNMKTNVSFFFTVMWPCIVTNFFTIKPTRCTNFSNSFWNETLHVLDSSSVHHQELFTVNPAMVYGIQVCRQLSSSSRIRMELVPSWSCSKAIYKLVWHVPLLGVQWITLDDGQRNCPKHAEFHSKMNLRN